MKKASLPDANMKHAFLTARSQAANLAVHRDGVIRVTVSLPEW